MELNRFELLKINNRIIAYDLRGHRKSEVGDGQYTIELFVDDLREKLPKKF